jgi:hypothetical protein
MMNAEYAECQIATAFSMCHWSVSIDRTLP